MPRDDRGCDDATDGERYASSIIVGALPIERVPSIIVGALVLDRVSSITVGGRDDDSDGAYLDLDGLRSYSLCVGFLDDVVDRSLLAGGGGIARGSFTEYVVYSVRPDCDGEYLEPAIRSVTCSNTGVDDSGFLSDTIDPDREYARGTARIPTPDGVSDATEFPEIDLAYRADRASDGGTDGTTLGRSVVRDLCDGVREYTDGDGRELVGLSAANVLVKKSYEETMNN